MKKILTGLVVILAVGVLLGYGLSWMTQQVQVETDRVPVVAIEALPEQTIQLYFTDPEGTFLVPETTVIPGCEQDRDCLLSLVRMLVKGSKTGLLPVFPQQTEVLNAEVENDLVRINLSRHAVDFHPGGSLSELLSIYSLANSLRENYPYLRQVQLLIEGEIKQTLKGHARIDQPIYADLSYFQSQSSHTNEEIGGGLSIEKLIEQVVPGE